MAETDPTPAPAPAPAPAPQADPPAPAPAPAADKHVPYERFKEVNDQLKALKDQIKSLTGEKEQQQTTAKTLEDRLAAIEKERSDAAAENLRLKVAARKQLPDDLADRLRGTTAEELEADADRLLAFVKPKSGPGVPPPAGGRPASRLDLSNMTAAEIRKARAEGKV